MVNVVQVAGVCPWEQQRQQGERSLGRVRRLDEIVDLLSREGEGFPAR